MSDLNQRAINWIASPMRFQARFMPARFVWAVMMGADNPFESVPDRPDSFAEVVALFRQFPEWKARMSELVDASPKWFGIVARYEELEMLYDEHDGSYEHQHDLYGRLQECYLKGLKVAGWTEAQA